MQTQPLLRVREVADTLGVSRQRVYQMIHDGHLPAAWISPRSIRIPAAAFEAWLDVQIDRSVDALRTSPTSAMLGPLNDEATGTQTGGFAKTTAAGSAGDAALSD